MKINIPPQDYNAVLEHLHNKPSDLFLIDFARHHIGRRRYLEAKDSLKITEDKASLWEDALAHNLRGLEDFGAIGRVNRLTRPLYAIDKVYFNAAQLKALCVGPRTEMELLSLVGQGFLPENIRGLDLFSYTPWIDTGNMHSMPYEDNSFDVVIAGWVLAYSSDPDQACREFLRVTKDRGIIAIGATVISQAQRATAGQAGRTEKHYPRADELLKVFGNAVGNVYVRHESEPGDNEGRTIVIFEVRKDGSGRTVTSQAPAVSSAPAINAPVTNTDIPFYAAAIPAVAAFDATLHLRHDLRRLYEAGLRAMDKHVQVPEMRSELLETVRMFARFGGSGAHDFLTAAAQLDTALQGVLLWELNKMIIFPAVRNRIAQAIADAQTPVWQALGGAPTAGSLELAEDGITHVPQLVSPSEAKDMLAYFEGCKTTRDNTTLHHDMQDVLLAPHAFRIAADPKVLETVRHFLGAPPTVVQMDAWWSLPGDEPWGAQVFHRDKDDFKACKLFVYLNDVGPDSGPHIFVRGSQRTKAVHEALSAKGLADEVPMYFAGNGRFMADKVADVFGAAVTEITGGPGTCFIENTFGFHRGKVPKTGKRCIFQVNYASVVYPERLARWSECKVAPDKVDAPKNELGWRALRYAFRQA